jgi:ribosomal-protein-alanine N-acetyltransferase
VHDRIATDRLTLHPFTVEDLEALHRIWADPETIWWGAHTNLAQTRTLLAFAVTEGWWAVEHGEIVVGDVFLRTSKHDPQALELGYHFGSAFWGKGFATEACRAVITTASGYRIQAPIVPENVRSRCVATKLGFSIVGQVSAAKDYMTYGNVLHVPRKPRDVAATGGKADANKAPSWSSRKGAIVIFWARVEVARETDIGLVGDLGRTETLLSSVGILLTRRLRVERPHRSPYRSRFVGKFSEIHMVSPQHPNMRPTTTTRLSPSDAAREHAAHQHQQQQR